MVALESPEERVRRLALNALTYVDLTSRGIILALISALKYENEHLRRDVESLLKRGGPGATEALITALAQSAMSQIRSAAASILGENGMATASAIEALKVAINDSDSEVAAAARNSLRKIKHYWSDEVPLP